MFISSLFQDKTRSYIQKLIEKWCVQINWKIASKSDKIKPRDVISMIFEVEKSELIWEDLPLEIIYQNDDFAVINKDPHMNVHQVPWFWWNSWTLVNALLHHMKWLSVIWWVERPWIVHRLDKWTSWLILIAKRDRAMHTLQVLMNKRQISKTYLALVIWVVIEHEWYIESYIWRDPVDRKKMTVKDPVNPKLAKTKFKVLGYLDNKYTLVEVDLLTWRTHQIRVHFASIGFPLVWDVTYWNEKINKEFEEKYNLNRQYLHAWKLSFSAFSTNYSFEAPLKSDLTEIYKKINFLN